MRTKLLIGLLCGSCWTWAQETPFVDITAAAGIEHEFIVYEGLLGGGACVFDADKDGFEDLYITGGMGEDRFYLNNGDGTLRNVFEGSGLEVTRGFGTQGVTIFVNMKNPDGTPNFNYTLNAALTSVSQSLTYDGVTASIGVSAIGLGRQVFASIAPSALVRRVP